MFITGAPKIRTPKETPFWRQNMSRPSPVRGGICGIYIYMYRYIFIYLFIYVFIYLLFIYLYTYIVRLYIYMVYI